MRPLLICVLSLGLASALLAESGEDPSAPHAHHGTAPQAKPDIAQPVSGDMMRRCEMMMKTAIDPSDPAAILAIKGELKLTPRQVQRLQALADKARRKAKALLNERQVQAVEAIPAQPDTPMAMLEHMMGSMHGGQPASGETPKMSCNCPMMNMAGSHAATEQPATAAPAAADHAAHHH